MAALKKETEPGYEEQHVNATPDTEENEKHNLEQRQILEIVDLENRTAFKGDDSDGHVKWNAKSLAAACFLCMLYTGKPRSSPRFSDSRS